MQRAPEDGGRAAASLAIAGLLSCADGDEKRLIQAQLVAEALDPRKTAPAAYYACICCMRARILSMHTVPAYYTCISCMHACMHEYSACIACFHAGMHSSMHIMHAYYNGILRMHAMHAFTSGFHIMHAYCASVLCRHTMHTRHAFHAYHARIHACIHIMAAHYACLP